jgi:hypothetical protein
MQEGGVDAAEGANALKSGLASLINPTKQATAMLSGMGINLQTIIEANKGDLMGTVQSFAQALGSLDQFSRQQALEQVFGKFQYAKLGALFENISREGSQAQQVIATMGYTTEQLGATADKELKTIEESFGVQLTGAVERFKLAIAPIGQLFVQLAIPIVNFATKLIEGFNGLTDGQKKLTAIAAVIVGVVIPAVTMMAGLFLNLVGTLAKIGQGIALFGKGFITGGPVGAVKALTQSSKYLSLAEMDAAMAAQQLSGASQILNTTLMKQVGTANAAAAAIANLTKAYSSMAATQAAAGNLPTFGIAGAAGAAAREGKTSSVRVRGLRRNSGGGVPGSGNTDTVPAMLTPGEFVINKEATKNNLGLLQAINDGKTQGFNKGGVANGVQYLNRGAIVSQARSILDIIRRNNGKIGTLDDFLMSPTVSSDVKKRLSRHASISRSGGFPTSKTQMSPTIKRSTEKTHFGDKQQVLSLEELGLILGTKGGSKRKIAEALIKGGIPVQSLTDDWILLPKSINQAARLNTTSPMNISSAIKELRSNVGAVKFKDRKKDSAFSVLNPNETSSSFVEKIIKELEEYSGDSLITDDILTLARNKAYPNMSGAGRSTGIRLPNKSEIGTLAGVDVNSPSFTKAVNDYFKQNNIPLSTDLIVPKKIGSNNWWALQLLDSVGGNITNVKNKFASSTGFNTGGPVPGTGNTDTVPAMLTPGEFVVNKKAASQNQGILEMMNGGQVKGYAVGGLVAGAKALATSRTGKFIGGTAASIGGYEAGSALTGGNMIGGLAGSIITPMLPKAAAAAASAMGVSAAAFAGITAPLALAGFAIYKFNKGIGEAEKSGAEFTNAMYGTSKTIEGIAKQFGTQTNAQLARISAVERIGGQSIGEEAQQKSAQFVESEAGKQMLQDVGTVKAGGGNAVEALKNQLSAAIISGAIGTEEARAIAVEVGTALGDQSIAVGVSGELTRLMGPDGGDLLKNLSSITAEISPKIDANKLAADASSAYEKMNAGEKFVQLFQGGEAEFTKNYQLDKISAANSSAFAKETQARELLNLAYQEGTISLKEFQSQSSAITKSSEANQDLAAKALGFQNQSDLVAGASQVKTVMVGAGRGAVSTEVGTEKQKQAKAVLDAQKIELEKMLLEIPGQTEDTVAKITESVGKLGAGAFGDILSGRLNLADVEILVKLKDSGLNEKEIEGVNDKLQALKKFPDIDTLINVKTTSQAEITQLYDAMVKFDEMPDKELNVYAKDNFTGIMQQIGVTYDQFAALPDLEKRVVLAKMEVLADVKLTLNGNMDMDQGSRKDYADQVSKLMQSITGSFTAGSKTGSGSSSSSSGSGGGKGNDAKQKLEELKKMLMERFRLQEMLIDKEAEGFNNRVKQLNREIELEQRQVSLREKALDQLSKKEDEVNEAYDLRVEALDKVSESNSRIGEQEKSRISLASALASGDIAAAASISSEMQQQSAQYQIEDARAALESQRQKDLESLTVSVNGKMMTRKGIEESIETIQNRIYDKGILLQGVQDSLQKVEEKKLAIAKEREKVETRMYLMAQKQAIQDLTKANKKKPLSKEDQAALADYKASYNLAVDMYNQANPGSNLKRLNYGGHVARMANGGIAYKGSTEAPPAMRMAFGSTVPGKGMTDKVPALLTPGEFVVRKSVADKNRGMLQALNGQVFPGVAGTKNKKPNLLNKMQIPAMPKIKGIPSPSVLNNKIPAIPKIKGVPSPGVLNNMGAKVPKNNFLDGIKAPTYPVPQNTTANVPTPSPKVASPSSTMYNSTYNVNVNVSGTNASPDDIANVVMAKLSQQNRGNLRSNRY